MTHKHMPKYSGAFDKIHMIEGTDDGFIATVYIKEVIYNNPATIVLWNDGMKTVAKCAEGDIYSPETGLAICVLKRLTSGAQIKNLFNDWLPLNNEKRITLHDVIKKSEAETKKVAPLMMSMPEVLQTTMEDLSQIDFAKIK